MSRAVASLAIVKAMYEKYKRDYIENFIPFLATLIKQENIKEIDPKNLNEFINLFEKKYGLQIPYHPMLSIILRARKRKILKKAQHLFIPDINKILEYDFTDEVIIKEGKINQLLDEILVFCDGRGINSNLQEIESALLIYLKNHDLDILFASQETSLLRTEALPSKKVKYLIFEFISHAKKSRPEQFATIIDICVGHILANSIVYTNDTHSFSGKLEGVIIYLDSRFLFRLIGVEGLEYQNAYSDLVLSMEKQNAKLKIFSHTYDEMTVILNNCLKYICSSLYDSAKANPVLQYFVSGNYSESDIHQYISELETQLENYKILVEDAPEFITTVNTQVCEATLREQIIRAYSNNSNFDELKRETTIDRDIKSVSSIYHLRKGSTSRSLKGSKYIFLTTNIKLAFICRKYGYEISEPFFYIPVCLTDVFLGTLVWMQSPIKWIEINKKKVIANLMAASKPDNNFIKKLALEAKSLREKGRISDEEYMMLNRSFYLQKMLYDESIGDYEALTPAEVENVFKQNEQIAIESQKQLVEKKQENEETQKCLSVSESKNDEIVRKVSEIFNIGLDISHRTVTVILVTLTIIGLFLWGLVTEIILGLLTIIGICFGFNLMKYKTKLKQRFLTWLSSL